MDKNFELPDLIEVQRTSFFNLLEHGLQEELKGFGPLVSKNKEFEFHIDWKRIFFRKPKATPQQTIFKKQTYACEVEVNASIYYRGRWKNNFTEYDTQTIRLNKSSLNRQPKFGFQDSGIKDTSGSPNPGALERFQGSPQAESKIPNEPHHNEKKRYPRADSYRPVTQRDPASQLSPSRVFQGGSPTRGDSDNGEIGAPNLNFQRDLTYLNRYDNRCFNSLSLWKQNKTLFQETLSLNQSGIINSFGAKAPNKNLKPLSNLVLVLGTRLDNLVYQQIRLGFPFLTLGILSGAIWANQAWGSYWSWDPKETWAFITWLIFAIYLHVRLNLGWEARQSARVAVFGFFIIWICFLGVNLLGKGLHSYGFVV
jgi:hypothetical protein